jgi:uncharacterized protein with von Willebrand factor type A (vWA) domain
MTRRSASVRTKTPRPRAFVPAVPAEAAWIESDSYDRRAWKEIVADAPAIAELVETGDRLVPHFDSLMQDLFLSLFKYNLVWQKPDAVRRSAVLNRTILGQFLDSPAFEALKTKTLLEEDKAAIAAIALGENVIEMVRSEKLINRREMLDLWDLEHQEKDLAERAEALKNAIEMAEQREAGDEELAKKAGELKDAAERAAKVSEARLNQKARIVEEQLKQADLTELKRMQLESSRLADEIDRVAQDTHDFSLEFASAGGRLSAGERLELGRRLARNKKIGELARMVGRFKQEARALRRKAIERGATEAYDVERGSEIGRLIPAELLALHDHRLVRDFRRRLLEGAVLQYRLRDDEQKGKGPMVVCVDVSSSMEGAKELWAKAVCLTLMDIARRQRRLVRAVLFSSGDKSLKVLDLNNKRRYELDFAKVMDLAEYFPGGGTDFEQPLNAAMQLIEEKQLKRADIVMITDGESQVSPEWLARTIERKQRLNFKIFAVLVDVGSSELSTLARFADKVASVKQLSSKDTREIFVSV